MGCDCTGTTMTAEECRRVDLHEGVCRGCGHVGACHPIRTGVIACTDESMHAGGFGPLPRDPKALKTATAEEREHLIAIARAVAALRTLGWQAVIYAPRDCSPFLSIAAGSTGVQEGSRDEEGRFWVYDGDVWPDHPILWRPLRDEPTSRK